ncbi:hypothetical protein DICSQDRAFT_175348 [Dichomitus squalens LYAD-421 SS1]|uniref:Cytochrome P450 n=2 Tax=Dichomitus squalens TaxID=114155 RepID=A0A4V2JZ32_9APHY|nr:uncharacterized protein DICSQDRAFT_175348 [Dichomitus squalens LYAD-421 SS1]EJF55954.1 hypothetical protein DICSQDRAFT_175348 [Dichomitus squalens LYAD-421 SS1]TBU23433.1 hypothetical protein BD311DRAFT_673945 [Dichomitus squalens]
MPYGSFWRNIRRALYQRFNSDAVSQFRPVLLQETHKLLKRLTASPDDVVEHIRLTIQVLKCVRDENHIRHRSGYSRDELVMLEDNLAKAFEMIYAPGSYLVESFPFLRYVPVWFPGANFQKDAADFKEIFSTGLHKPFDVTSKNMRSGEYLSSLASSLVQQAQAEGEPD